MLFETLTFILFLSRPTLGSPNDKEPNRATGAKVAKWNEDSGVNPEELGDYSEGDIVIPTNKLQGNARETLLWPGGRVYYEISLDFDDQNQKQIKNAMTHISNQTCIKFIPRTSDQPDYVKITAEDSGCWTSSVGRLGGEQLVNLQVPSCLRKMGNIAHQLLHVLGLGHEHNRPDRDQYVDILWKNVDDGYAKNFNKIVTHASVLELPYDPYSIMHYSPRAFASDKQLNTIEPKSRDVSLVKMGQRDGLSSLDVQKINKLYEKECSAQVYNITKFF